MSQCVDVAVLWAETPRTGRVEVAHGRLAGLRVAAGSGRVSDDRFTFSSQGPGRLAVLVADARLGAGAYGTRVTIHAEPRSVTFFLRDVDPAMPILVAPYGVAVTAGEDTRDYRQVEMAARARGLVSESQRIEAEPEETYEGACRYTRAQTAPTWLGLSRDMRIFSVHYDEHRGYWGMVEPRYHSTVQHVPESGAKPVRVHFAIGRGAACQVDITRRLDQGVLPILHAVQQDGEVAYHLALFATLETHPISLDTLRGSHALAVYANTGGNMLTSEERKRFEEELETPEMRERDEETVCCVHIEAVNTGAVPRYAFVKGLHLPAATNTRYDPERGLCLFTSGRVFGVQLLDGQPLPQEEVALLLRPGQAATVDFLIPHQPVPPDRAARLAAQDVGAHLEACRLFWRTKLGSAAQVHLPERAIDERVRAGLLHLDLAALGLEPDGPVAATIGWYAPIGSESAPIIQFFDSMGWHDLARRSLQFFLDRQCENGFIQTFGGYQLETGPVLWSLGEHYRYTRDDAWVHSVRPKVLKACEYLIAWRDRNKQEGLRGTGYGLLDGKTADPEDYFHSFMLNGVSYLGLARAAEMLHAVDPSEANRLAEEAEAYRQDIRGAYLRSMARSPVVPLGDGTWVPSFAPWAEYPGPVALYAEGGTWHTHGAFVSRDSLLGPLYLVLGEVFECHEQATEFMLRSHQVLGTLRNAGFSQPYYCRHDDAHLKRGEVKAFLKTYYNQMAALQDRQTYSFWEHYFHASQHKTHEEAWFLMQTRWMLYREAGDTLRLLPAVPRRWFEDGNTIELNRWASYFGPFSLKVASHLADGVIEAEVVCDTDRPPGEVLVRLPHPQGRRPSSVSGGAYDQTAETVRILGFKEAARVTLRF